LPSSNTLLERKDPTRGLPESCLPVPCPETASPMHALQGLRKGGLERGMIRSTISEGKSAAQARHHAAEPGGPRQRDKTGAYLIAEHQQLGRFASNRLQSATLVDTIAASVGRDLTALCFTRIYKSSSRCNCEGCGAKILPCSPARDGPDLARERRWRILTDCEGAMVISCGFVIQGPYRTWSRSVVFSVSLWPNSLARPSLLPFTSLL
jgi:hypothetical protein